MLGHNGSDDKGAKRKTHLLCPITNSVLIDSIGDADLESNAYHKAGYSRENIQRKSLHDCALCYGYDTEL